MADTDQILKLLVKVEGELSKFNDVQKGLNDLKANLGSAGQAAQLLGTALGIAIPTTFIGALITAINLYKQFEDEQDRIVEATNRAREAIHDMQTAALQSAEAFQKLNQFKTQPLVQQIATLEAALIRLKTELSLAFQTGSKDAADLEKQIQAVGNALETLRALAKGAVIALKDKEALDFARAYGTQTDINRAKLVQLTDQVLAAHKAVGTEISRGQAEQIAQDQIRAEEQDKIRAEAEKEANARDSITPMLRDQMTLLQHIRQTQQLINEAPFMGADEKQRALLASSRQEMQNIAQAIQTTQSTLKGSGLDATQYEQLDQRLQLLRFRFQQLGQDIQKLSVGGSLRAELTQWANSFGDTGQQIAKTIEGTIGASLQSVNQFLVTGKFNAQALLQQLVLLGLQLVEQMIIQRVMAAINAAAAAGQAAATGPVVAAAWAPAATAATIATQGAAALQAPAAVAGALAAIMGTLVVAHEGGAIRRRRMHSGGLAADEVPIIAEEGEFMVRKSVAQRPGVAEYLMGLNEGFYHEGGDIERMHDGGEPEFSSRWLDPATWVGGRDPGEYDPSSYRYWSTFFRSLPFGMTPGYLPPPFTPGWGQGPTMIPTTFTPQGYPRAIPVGWAPTGADFGPISGSRHMGMRKPKHEGGLISRYHDGGSISGSGAARGGIHIYAFTDLKQLTKHMASRDGQKIIFDTVNGRRIDLGMK